MTETPTPATTGRSSGPARTERDRADRARTDPSSTTTTPTGKPTGKKVYLVATFHVDGDGARLAPASGIAEDVVAVIGTEGEGRRFAWVGEGPEDSVTNPALVTPVRVRTALPSPWHPDGAGMVTGLVQLAPEQLGDGSVDEDVDHLLSELSRSRHPAPPPRAEAADGADDVERRRPEVG